MEVTEIVKILDKELKGVGILNNYKITGKKKAAKKIVESLNIQLESLEIFIVSFDTISIILYIEHHKLYSTLISSDSNFFVKQNKLYYAFDESTKVECYIENVTHKTGIIHTESH